MAELIKGYDAVDLSVISLSDGEGMRGPELSFYAQSTEVVAIVEDSESNDEKTSGLQPLSSTAVEIFTAPSVTDTKNPYFLRTNE